MAMGLHDLPIFEESPFHKGCDVPVHEMARITYNHTPQSFPRYQKQVVRFVMGKSPDFALIYVASDCMLREGGELFAIEDNDGNCIGVRDIAKYEILSREQMQLLKTEYLRI